ncbi:MAG: radical SAM protein [Candidatus Woesearchaeota archaeon]
MLKKIERAKIELMTYGMNVSETARRSISGDEGRPLTLADYASTSGISMVLGDNIWVNAPIRDYNPNFVNETYYTLDFRDEGFFVDSDGIQFKTIPVPVPAYHKEKAPSGDPYIYLAITHTDRVRISPIGGCAIACHFCDMSYTSKYRKKDIEDLVDSVRVALEDPIQEAHHVLISGGTPKPKDYEYEREVYRAVASVFPEIDVDVMMVPMPGLLDAQELKEIGIHGLSINLELYNQDMAKKIMKGKWKASRQMYLDFIEDSIPIFGVGNVRSLLMVGIEPLEDTLRGVEALAERGCDPVLSPFRPDQSTPMMSEKPPSVNFLIETYERAREIVEKFEGVKLGPRCIPCHHNTLTFPDDSGLYYNSGE